MTTVLSKMENVQMVSDESLDALLQLCDIESLRNIEFPDLNNVLNQQPFINEAIDDDVIQYGGDNQALVEISRGRSRLNRFRLETNVIRYRIAPPPDGMDPIEWTNRAFRGVYDEIIRAGGAGNNRFCLTFNFEGLNNGEAWERPRAIAGYEFEDLWNLVRRISQSGGGFDVLDTFTITLHVAEAPVGQCTPENSDLRRQKGVICINNPNDKLCLPRALAVADVFADKQIAQVDRGELNEECKVIRDSRGSIQKEAAMTLTQAAGVNIPEDGCGYEEIVKFQDFFANRGTAIIVYIHNVNDKKDHPVFYDGTGVVRRLLGIERPQRILRLLLYPEEKHFDTIVNLRTFQGYKNYCEPCRKGYYRKTAHKCPSKCSQCLQSPACHTKEQKRRCNECNREFYGKICFDNHKKQGSFRFGNETVCKNLKYCIQCKKNLYNQQYGFQHKCGINYCTVCRVERPEIHDCYMPVAKLRRETKNKCNAFVYYDLETRQEDSMKGAECVYIHVPNLCIAQIVCEKCCNDDDSGIDGTETNTNTCCGVREFIFYGGNCEEKVYE